MTLRRERANRLAVYAMLIVFLSIGAFYAWCVVHGVPV
jgi:hypothetical protein